MVEATNLIGSDQIQGRATMAGNLCNASPAADSVPAMVAAGAKANVVGPNGRRTVAVEKIPTGPGKTSLKKGEIIESISLPKKQPKSGDAYLRFIPRTEMDIAVVSAGVNLTHRQQGRDQESACCPGRGGADGAAGRLMRRRPSSAASWTTRRWQHWRLPVRQPASPSTICAAPSSSERK